MVNKDRFDECQFCRIEATKFKSGEDVPYNFIAVNYYHTHLMHLCDRCVDKLNSYRNGRNIDEYWEEADAKRCGYPPFPYRKLIDQRKKVKHD